MTDESKKNTDLLHLWMEIAYIKVYVLPDYGDTSFSNNICSKALLDNNFTRQISMIIYHNHVYMHIYAI